MDQPGFAADILREPAALAALLDRYAEPGRPARRRLAGRRPARAAARHGQLAVRRPDGGGAAARRAASTPTSSWRRRRGRSRRRPTRSRSASPPRARAPRRSRRSRATTARSRTIALTNYPERELATHADVVLPMLAGPEEGGIACRSFQATLAVLHLLAGVPAGCPAAGGGSGAGTRRRPRCLARRAARAGRRRARVRDRAVRAALLGAAVGADVPGGAADRRRRLRDRRLAARRPVPDEVPAVPGAALHRLALRRRGAALGARARLRRDRRRQDDRGGRPARSGAGRPPGSGSGRDDGGRARGVRALAPAPRLARRRGPRARGAATGGEARRTRSGGPART